MTSCVAGVVRRLKAVNQREVVFGVLHRLVNGADCVDKGVITEIIDLGTNYIADYDDALGVGTLSLEMVHQDSVIVNQPNDTRASCAIRTGLIEMCLGFIEQFSEHESFHDNDELSMNNSSEIDVPMYTVIECIFQSINNVSLHQKTAKAIRSKKSSAEKKLVRLEGDKRISNKPESKKLLDMVRSILNLSGSYCCRCNKSLTRTEVKQCNGCIHMTYCSRACQREDWLNGHSVTCCESYSDETAGQFQGRLQPMSVPQSGRAATKLEELEKNQTMLHLKLFLNNSETILSRAKELNLPLHDCAVAFNLSKCPPEVRIGKYSDKIKEETRIGFEKSRTKENITCLFYSPLYYGDLRLGEHKLFQQRLFPHEWLTKKS